MIANMESEQVAHFLEKESSRMLRLYAFCSKIVIHENNLTCTDVRNLKQIELNLSSF